jgi:hypothetical protein
MGGHDLKSDKVRTLVLVCLAGSAATDTLKDVGIAAGKHLTEQTINKLSADAIARINRKMGFQMVAKFGQKGVIKLGKAIPLVGGVIGAMIDAVSTNVVGNAARDTFIAQAVVQTNR